MIRIAVMTRELMAVVATARKERVRERRILLGFILVVRTSERFTDEQLMGFMVKVQLWPVRGG